MCKKERISPTFSLWAHSEPESQEEDPMQNKDEFRGERLYLEEVEVAGRGEAKFQRGGKAP